MTADIKYAVVLEDEGEVGSFIASPTMLEEAVLGFLLDGDSVASSMVILDVNRHAAMMKVAGASLKAGSYRNSLTPVVVTTGRISADMVRIMSLVGIRIIASYRHVLMSGVTEAQRSCITLVSKDFTRKLKVFTNPNRLISSPMAGRDG